MSVVETEAFRRLTPPLRLRYCPLTPTAKQFAFLQMRTREVFYGGAAGGGKSIALLMAALQYADVPGYAALILRKTYSDLVLPGALMDVAGQWLAGTDARWNEGKHEWAFPGGGRLVFGYLDGPRDKNRYQCFDDETEVLTSEGWRKISEVKVAENVATVDPSSNELEYRPVSEVHSYPYDGELVSVHRKAGPSFRVTPNHVVWAGTERVRKSRPFYAEDLPRMACVPQVFAFFGGTPEGFRFARQTRDDIEIPAEQWVRYLGWFVSEGSGTSLSQSKPQGRLLIAEHLGGLLSYRQDDWDRHNIGGGAALRQWLEANTLHPFCPECGGLVSKRPNLMRYDCLACGWPGGLGALPTLLKKLPDEVFTWGQEWAEMLLETLVMGDGSVRYAKAKRSGGAMVYLTSSKQLADDVMRLAVHAGWRPTLLVHEGGEDPQGPHSAKGRKSSPKYRVSLSKRQRPAAIGRTEREQYVGNVYCLTVPPHHTLVIRHRGRVSLSGNSAAFHYIGYDELTHFREGDYLYLFSRARRPESPRGRAPDGTGANEVPIRIRAASNPGGFGHDWVNGRFVTPATRKPGVIFLPAKLTENPYLDQEDYLKQLAELGSVDRARLLEGDWEASDEGAVFSREWFQPTDDTACTRVIRYWDTAATAPSESNSDPDWTVGVLMGRRPDNTYVVLDVQRARLSPGKTDELIQQTTYADGYGVEVWIQEEPGSASKILTHHFAKQLSGFTVRPHRVGRSDGDKSQRAKPWAAALENSLVTYYPSYWIHDFISEHAGFPNRNHDDQVDAASGAHYILSTVDSLRRRTSKPRGQYQVARSISSR